MTQQYGSRETDSESRPAARCDSTAMRGYGAFFNNPLIGGTLRMERAP
ncbi:hypothetical protein [Acetobacter nitrogenifigens]|nr:hypothetical protein [Acetobacter nitrogenifigens]